MVWAHAPRRKITASLPFLARAGLAINWDEMQDHITRLMGMGFSRDQVLVALVVCQRNVERVCLHLDTGRFEIDSV